MNIEQSIDNSVNEVSNTNNLQVNENNEINQNLDVDNKVVTDNKSNLKSFGLFIGNTDIIHNTQVNNHQNLKVEAPIKENTLIENTQIENNIPVRENIPIEQNTTTIVDNTKIDQLSHEIDILKTKIENTPEPQIQMEKVIDNTKIDQLSHEIELLKTQIENTHEPQIQIEKVIDNTKIDQLSHEIEILKTQIEMTNNQQVPQPIIQTQMKKEIDNTRVDKLSQEINNLKLQLKKDKNPNQSSSHEIKVKLDPQEVKINLIQPPQTSQVPPQITHIHNIYVKHHINVKKDVIVPHHVIIPHHVIVPHDAIIPIHTYSEEKIVVPHHVIIPHNVGSGDDSDRIKDLEDEIKILKEKNGGEKIVHNDLNIHLDVKQHAPEKAQMEKKIIVMPVLVKGKEKKDMSHTHINLEKKIAPVHKDRSYTHINLENEPIDIDDSFNTSDLDSFMKHQSANHNTSIHVNQKDDSFININNMYSHLFPENNMNDQNSIISTNEEPMVFIGKNSHHHHTTHNIHHDVHHVIHHDIQNEVHDNINHNVHHIVHHNIHHKIHHNIHHNVDNYVHHNIDHNVHHNIDHNVHHNTNHNVHHSMNYLTNHNINNNYNEDQNTLNYLNTTNKIENNINEVVHPTTDIYDFQYHPQKKHTTVHKYHPSAYLNNYDENDVVQNLDDEDLYYNHESDQEYYDGNSEVKREKFYNQDENGLNHKIEKESIKGNSLRDEGYETILDDHDILNVEKTDYDDKNVDKNKLLVGTFNKNTMNHYNGTDKTLKGGILSNENEVWDDRKYDGKKDKSITFKETSNKGDELIGIKHHNETKNYDQESLIHKKNIQTKYGYKNDQDLIVGNEKDIKKLAYDQSKLGLLKENSSSSKGIIDNTIIEKDSKNNLYHHYNKTDLKTATEKEDNLKLKNFSLDLEKNKKHLTVHKRSPGIEENKYRKENKISGKIHGVDVNDHHKEINIKKNEGNLETENHIREHKGNYGHKHHHHKVHKKKVKNDLFEDEQTVTVKNVSHNGLI